MGKKIHGRDKNPLLWVTRPSWTKSTIKVLLSPAVNMEEMEENEQ